MNLVEKQRFAFQYLKNSEVSNTAFACVAYVSRTIDVAAAYVVAT